MNNEYDSSENQNGVPNVEQGYASIEQTVLALALSRDEDVVNKITLQLTPEMFVEDRSKLIFKAITGLLDDGLEPDNLTVYNKLRSMGSGIPIRHLLDLDEYVVASKNVDYYIGKIKDGYEYIKLQNFCMETINVGLADEENPKTSIKEFLAERQQEFFKINMAKQSINIAPSDEAVARTLSEISAGSVGIPTGFPRLDKLLYGLQKGYLIIVAGRPSIGKTSLALTMLEHISVMKKIPSLFVSIEMNEVSLVRRLLASYSGLSPYKLRTGNMSDEEYTTLSHATGAVGDAPFYIVDAPSLSLPQLSALCRQSVKQFNTQVIFVDYLQLIKSVGRTRNEEVANISAHLKSIARELNVPVVALSQLSRAGENRVPSLSDLRDSGALEQDADQVIFVHRKRDDDGLLEKEGQIIIGKARNESVGLIDAVFDQRRTRWAERYLGEE